MNVVGQDTHTYMTAKANSINSVQSGAEHAESQSGHRLEPFQKLLYLSVAHDAIIVKNTYIYLYRSSSSYREGSTSATAPSREGTQLPGVAEHQGRTSESSK